MAQIVRFHQLPPSPFMWTLPAAVQLVRERRVLNHLFASRTRNTNYDGAWAQISNNLFAATGFVATPNQCRSKWQALKRGYENLSRVIRDNPRDYPLTSPNNFDHACYLEMSDEFWLQSSNYIFYFKFGFVFIWIIYLFISFIVF
jgi:hypothetical protein